MSLQKKTVAAVAVAFLATLGGDPARADPVRDAQWFTRYLNLERAHQISRGDGVEIALIDSGVEPHVDLSNNLLRGIDTISGGDGSGQVDANDGHGTKMAGIIAAHGHGTSDGVIGVAPKSKIVPVKAVGARDNGQGVISGIEWSAARRVDVINLSVTIPRSRGLSDALGAAVAADSVIVAGAGNKSENLRLGYPAASPETLAVGAVDQDGKIAEFSVTGPEIDICAPGVDIVSTIQENKYYKGSGTSQATAVVSGAAALVRAKYPDLSAPEVIHRLTATAKDNGPPGRDDQCGYGVLDIVKALTAEVPPLSSSAGPGSAGPTGSASAPDASSVPAGAGAPPTSDSSSSVLPAIAGVGAAVLAIGAVLAFLVRRRRRSQSSGPST